MCSRSQCCARRKRLPMRDRGAFRSGKACAWSLRASATMFRGGCRPRSGKLPQRSGGGGGGVNKKKRRKGGEERGQGGGVVLVVVCCRGAGRGGERKCGGV